jgi:prepilin-type N-terminal cleavage/methylation domain-containing protein/prepilin-type processing-associated H-X9-DG protein
MSGKFSYACTRRGGFTLVELMVVLAIIVILVAMLMPFMDGIRERGYVTLCQNNLEKISQSMAVAASKNGGRMPTDQSWILTATTYGSKEILVCPKGTYKGGGSTVDFTKAPSIEVIAPPASAALGALESNTKIRMWQERSSFVLPVSVSVNAIPSGTATNHTTNFSSVVGTIPAGTTVDCYFLHFDPVGSQSASVTNQAITFSGDIIGVLWNVSTLDATDQVLGSPSTAGYETGVGARGYENGAENVTLSADKRTFTINTWVSTSPGEETRILTVPGGVASYGMNMLVGASPIARPEQIYIVEYDRDMVNINDPTWVNYIAKRHYGKSNALFMDGSVKLLSPEQYDTRPGLWQPNR